MLAVRDRAKDCGDAGEIIAVVELTLRKPDGSLPTNWPFPAPWRPAVRGESCEAVSERAAAIAGYGSSLVTAVPRVVVG